ncbi:MAG: hypothetical protein ACRDPK_01310 [Carbonactinosporaceae bacterium]
MAPQRQHGYLPTLGLLFSVAGGTLIALGWHGSAREACVDCQVPYLISGGLGGLALVLLGTGLLIVAQIRVESAKLAQRLDWLVEAGTGSTASVHLDASDLVLTGDSAYHRPDCRLVKTHDDLPTRTVEMARAYGLVPCRVCWDADEAADGATETHRLG